MNMIDRAYNWIEARRTNKEWEDLLLACDIAYEYHVMRVAAEECESHEAQHMKNHAARMLERNLAGCNARTARECFKHLAALEAHAERQATSVAAACRAKEDAYRAATSGV